MFHFCNTFKAPIYWATLETEKSRTRLGRGGRIWRGGERIFFLLRRKLCHKLELMHDKTFASLATLYLFLFILPIHSFTYSYTLFSFYYYFFPLFFSQFINHLSHSLLFYTSLALSFSIFHSHTRFSFSLSLSLILSHFINDSLVLFCIFLPLYLSFMNSFFFLSNLSPFFLSLSSFHFFIILCSLLSTNFFHSQYFSLFFSNP